MLKNSWKKSIGDFSSIPGTTPGVAVNAGGYYRFFICTTYYMLYYCAYCGIHAAVCTYRRGGGAASEPLECSPCMGEREGLTPVERLLRL